MALLYKNLSNELVENIQSGVFKTGERLPGVRALSQTRRVSAATVVAAYRELETAGLIEARDRSGFYVKGKVCVLQEPDTSSPKFKPKEVSNTSMAMQMVQASNQPGMIPLGAAIPTPRHMPLAKIEQTMRKVMRNQRAQANTYAFPPGVGALRQQLAQRLASQGVRVSPEQLLITNGAQEALYLALTAVTKPGDTVVVESPCYYGTLLLLEHLGLKALEIPTHPRDGIALAALELALEKWPIKACIVVPSFSNPLGGCMSDANKEAMVQLLARFKVPLIEDDIYGDLAFNGHRPIPAKRWDTFNHNFYCGSFSKSLAPGLRVGWLVAPQAPINAKFVTSMANATAPQLVVVELLASGFYERHLKQVRMGYQQARERALDGVTKYFPEGTKVTQPEGGFLLWLELPLAVDGYALAEAALQQGVSIAPGCLFTTGKKFDHCMRLSCLTQTDAELDTALLRLSRLINTNQWGQNN